MRMCGDVLKSSCIVFTSAPSGTSMVLVLQFYFFFFLSLNLHFLKGRLFRLALVFFLSG